MNHAVSILYAAMLVLGGCGASTSTSQSPGVPREPWPDAATWEDARSQPLPPGVARVTIKRFEVDQRDRRTIEAAIGYDGEHVDVSAGSLGGRNGLILRGGGEGLEGALRVVRQSRESRSTSTQFLLLDEGSRGSLTMIESRPRPWVVVIPIYRGGIVVRTIREQVTGTGMYVGVERVGPDAVTVRLTPYFNRQRRDGALVIEELATTVTLTPGEPYVVMQDRRESSNVASALLSRTTTSEARQIVAVLEVDVGE